MLYNATAYRPLLDAQALTWLIYAAFAAALLVTALLPLFTSRTASAERDAPARPDNSDRQGPSR